MSAVHLVVDEELYIFGMLQNYDAMVSLVEDVECVPNNRVTNTVAIQHLYSFALNRYTLHLVGQSTHERIC